MTNKTTITLPEPPERTVTEFVVESSGDESTGKGKTFLATQYAGGELVEVHTCGENECHNFELDREEILGLITVLTNIYQRWDNE